MSCIFVNTIEITSVRSTSSLDIHCIVNKTLQYGFMLGVMVVVTNALLCLWS